eukprot:scaffold1954_cov268-Pinguiococcus_pyrenoidosus.AAC.110
MALEFGVYGIRVNSVNPTVVLTEETSKIWEDFTKAAPMLSKIPLGRFAEVGAVRAQAGSSRRPASHIFLSLLRPRPPKRMNPL